VRHSLESGEEKAKKFHLNSISGGCQIACITFKGEAEKNSQIVLKNMKFGLVWLPSALSGAGSVNDNASLGCL
jgi:hypothetical protein